MPTGSLRTTSRCHIKGAGNNLVFTYTGTLQSSTNVSQGYQDMTGAPNPYTIIPTAPAVFYRSHN